MVFWVSGEHQILTSTFSQIRFSLALPATRPSPKPVTPFSVLVLPNLSSSLTLGQPGASIFGCEQAARNWAVHTVPKRGLWNSTTWRERWGSQPVRLRRTPSDGEVPLGISQRISGRLSARGYIAQSVVELATVSLSKPTQMCIHGMRQVLPGVLPRSARVIYCSAIPSCGTCVSTK